MDIAVNDVVVRCADKCVGTVTDIQPNRVTIHWCHIGTKVYPEQILVLMFRQQKWMARRGNTRLHF